MINLSASLLQRLARNTTIRATGAFALSGFAFALGNLFLARSLPVAEFGRFSLEVALINLFAVIGPLGMDQAMIRQGSAVNPGTAVRAICTNMLVSVFVAIGGVLFYDLPTREAAFLGLCIMATGVGTVASAGMRARGDEVMPMVMVVGSNACLLVASIRALFTPTSVEFVLIVLAAANLAIAMAAWAAFLLGTRKGASTCDLPRWSEALSLIGLVAVGALVIQIERLIIPLALDAQALAVFGVLSSVATFPFRLVTSSAGFALAPQLRNADSLLKRRKLVVRELKTIAALLLLSTMAILAIAPLLASWLTDRRYELGTWLISAACISGYVKVAQSLSRAVIIGCGSQRAVVRLNLIAWTGMVFSALGGILASRWGLAGLIAGTAAGSAIGNIPAFVMARRSIRSAA